MIKVKELIWTKEREEHIARHGVTIEEFEETVFGKHYAIKTRQGRYRLIGQTEDGSYLVVIIEPGDYGKFYPITARSAVDNERRLYQKKMSKALFQIKK